MKLFDPGDYWNSGFRIPDNIELNWNYCDNTAFYPVAIGNFLNQIKINNHNEVVVLWAAPNRLTLYPECVQAIESFSSKIQNTVVLFDGNYNNTLTPENFRYAQIPYFEHVARSTWPQTELNWTKKHTFIMVGTKDYPTRKFVLSRIVEQGVDSGALISYKQVNSNDINLSNYTQDQIDYIVDVADRVNARLPWPPLDDSIEFAQMSREVLLNTYINLITDTFFEGDVFVSEKVYTAIAHGQIFVMLAPAGTLRYLRGQGYRTFGDYIDESYDDVACNFTRLKLVTDLIIKLARADLNKLLIACQEIVLHNYKHFYCRNVNSQFIKWLT